MNISEAAKYFGLTAVTLRYYERVGIIPPVKRTKGGIRNYQQIDLDWIEFIKCMRDSGLSVDSLMRYTELYQLGNDTISERKQLLIEERNILLQKYNEMGTTLNRLNQKIQDYEDGKFVTPEQKAE